MQIAILGAGPAGLICARILQQHGFKPIIFEREPSLESRDQGGMLDLHFESGQFAMRKAGLWKEFMQHTIKGADAMRIVSHDGKVLLQEDGSGPSIEEFSRPEIDRLQLRRILLDSLQPETVKWNSNIAAIRASINDKDKHVVEFRDGSKSGPFDLIIGADGAWSKVRPLLTDVKPVYSGVTAFQLDHHLSNSPTAAKMNGDASMFAAYNDRGFTTHSNVAADHLRVYIFIRYPLSENFLEDSQLDLSNWSATSRYLVDKHFGEWSTEMQSFIIEGDPSTLQHRNIYALPPDQLQWTSKKGLTMVGDAAHLMSPFAGEGANLALLDGTQVALAIVKGSKSWTSDVYREVAKYETRSLANWREKAEESARNLDVIISKDAPETLLKLFKSFSAPSLQMVSFLVFYCRGLVRGLLLKSVILDMFQLSLLVWMMYSRVLRIITFGRYR